MFLLLTAPMHCSQLRGWPNHKHDRKMLTNYTNSAYHIRTLHCAVKSKKFKCQISSSYLSCGHYCSKGESTKSSDGIRYKELTGCCHLQFRSYCFSLYNWLHILFIDCRKSTYSFFFFLSTKSTYSWKKKNVKETVMMKWNKLYRHDKISL